MTTKHGFTLMSVVEFEGWLKNLKVARTVLHVQEHHTFRPDYASFKGSNHFELQKGMKNYHVANNGWSDIGQHFTTFPDGSIMTGRSMETSPACIFGNNAHGICIENLGNFDAGKDAMNAAHKDTIVRMTAALCTKFNIASDTNGIVYHHWFDLSTGDRNNGTKNNKSCPGTGFFGGNKVADSQKNLIPLVKAKMGGTVSTAVVAPPAKYVCVTANTLNIRTKPDASSSKATDRPPATLGSILRVYAEKNGWYRISSSKQHWVAGAYTSEVRRATVTADTLNVRSGPGANFSKTGSFLKGQEVFIIDEANGWCKISMDEKWVKKEFLKL